MEQYPHALGKTLSGPGENPFFSPSYNYSLLKPMGQKISHPPKTKKENATGRKILPITFIPVINSNQKARKINVSVF